MGANSYHGGARCGASVGRRWRRRAARRYDAHLTRRAHLREIPAALRMRMITRNRGLMNNTVCNRAPLASRTCWSSGPLHNSRTIVRVAAFFSCEMRRRMCSCLSCACTSTSRIRASCARVVATWSRAVGAGGRRRGCGGGGGGGCGVGMASREKSAHRHAPQRRCG